MKKPLSQGKGSSPRNCFSEEFRQHLDGIDWKKKYPYNRYNLNNNSVLNMDYSKSPWGTVLNNRYIIEIQYIDKTNGILCIFDNWDNNRIIKQKDVEIRQTVRNSIDVQDICEWKDWAENIINNL